MKPEDMSKKLFVYLVPALVVGIVAWLSLRTGGPRPVEIGESVPGFSLPVASNSPAGPAGPSVQLSDYRGHVLVLNFWAPWCPPCVEEAPSLESFAAKVRPMGVEVLGASECHDCEVADEEDPAALGAFISKFHVTYPIAHDRSRALATRYGTLQFPETYIIDRKGRLAEKIIGAYDWTDPRMLAFVRELAGPYQQQARN
jgi:cytochrome c biogenesis protein CcmG, thiol:disulfide interchange protein DsbE